MAERVVLVLDPDHRTSELLTSILDGHVYTVVRITDATSALALWRDEPPFALFVASNHPESNDFIIDAPSFDPPVPLFVLGTSTLAPTHAFQQVHILPNPATVSSLAPFLPIFSNGISHELLAVELEPDEFEFDDGDTSSADQTRVQPSPLAPPPPPPKPNTVRKATAPTTTTTDVEPNNDIETLRTAAMTVSEELRSAEQELHRLLQDNARILDHATVIQTERDAVVSRLIEQLEEQTAVLERMEQLVQHTYEEHYGTQSELKVIRDLFSGTESELLSIREHHNAQMESFRDEYQSILEQQLETFDREREETETQIADLTSKLERAYSIEADLRQFLSRSSESQKIAMEAFEAATVTADRSERHIHDAPHVALTEQIAALEEELAQLKDDLEHERESSSIAIAALEADLAAAKARRNLAVSEAQSASAQVSSTANDLAAAQANEQKLREELRVLTELTAKSKSTAGHGDVQVEQLRVTIAAINEKLRQKDEELSQKSREIDTLTTELRAERDLRLAAAQTDGPSQSQAPATGEQSSVADESTLVTELRAQRKAALETASRLQDRLHNVATEKDVAKAKAVEAERQLAQLVADVADKVAQYDQLRQQADLAQQALDGAGALADSLRTEVNDLQRQLGARSAEITALTEELSATRRELEQTVEQWEQAATEAAAAQVALENERTTARQLTQETEALRGSLAAGATERAALSEANANLQQQLVTYQGKVASLQARITELEAEAEQNSQICAELFQDLATGSHHLADAKKATADAEQETVTVRAQLEETQENLRIALVELDETRILLTTRSQEISALDAERTSLLAERTTLMASLTAVENELAEHKVELELQAESLTLWQTKTQSLETALTNTTAQLWDVTQHHEASQAALQTTQGQLDEEKRAVLVLKQQEEHLKQVIDRLNDELAQLTEDLERASELTDGLRAETYTFKSAAEQADTVVGELHAELARRSEQLEEARQVIEAAENRVREGDRERTEIQTRITSLEEQLQTAYEALEQSNQRTAALEGELQGTSEIVDEAAVAIDGLTTERNQLQGALNTAQVEALERAAALAVAKSNIESLEATLVETKDALREMEERWAVAQITAEDRLDQTKRETAAHIADLSQQLQAVQAALAKQRQLADTAHAEVVKLQAALDARTTAASQQEDVTELLRASLTAAQSETATLTAALADSRNQAEQLEQQAQQLSSELVDQRKQLAEFSGSLADEQNSHATLVAELLTQRTEVEQLLAKLQSASAENQQIIDLHHTEKASLQSTIDRLTADLNQLSVALDTANTERDEAQSAQSRLNDEAQTLRRRLAEAEKRLETLQIVNATDSADVVAVRVALDEAIITRDQLRESLDANNAALTAQHEATLALETTVSRLTQKLHNKSIELDNAQLQIEQLGVALSESEQSQDASLADLAAAVEERDHVLSALHDIRLRLEASQHSVATITADLETAREQNQHFLSEIEALRQTIADMQAQQTAPATPLPSEPLEKDTQVVALEQELTRVRRQLVTLTAELTEVRERAGDLEEARTYDAQDMDNLRKALDMARADAEAARIQTATHNDSQSATARKEFESDKTREYTQQLDRLKTDFQNTHAKIRRCLMELEQGQQRLNAGRQQLSSRRVALRNLAETWRQLEQMMREMAEDDAVRPHIARLATVLREMKVSLRETRSILENSEYLSAAQDELVKKLYTTLTTQSTG